MICYCSSTELTCYGYCFTIAVVEVPAKPQWPPTVYMPHNASVYINCTAHNNNDFWQIDLAGDMFDIFLQFGASGKVLNAHGVYELSRIETPGMPPTLRLLINDTQSNNKTIIRCFVESELHETTLYLYGKSSVR